MIRKYTTGAIILIAIIIATFAYIAYSLFSAPITPMAFILPFITFIWLFFQGPFGEYTGFVLKRKNFLTDGGAIGVLRKIEPCSGGLLIARVTTYRRFVKNKDLIIQEDAFGGVASMLSVTATIEIVDKAYKFEEVESKYCDAPEGTMFYHGTLSGIELPSKMKLLQKQLDYLDSVISKQETILEKAKTISSQESQEQNLNMLESSKKAAVLIRELAKAVGPTPRAKGRRDDGMEET